MKQQQKKVITVCIVLLIVVIVVVLYPFGNRLLSKVRGYSANAVPSTRMVPFNLPDGFIFPNTVTSHPADSIPVLVYHGIVDSDNDTDVSYTNFKNQMLALKKAGWQTVSIEDFYAFMQGTKELPEKSFLLTFDDSRKDSYYPVDPILEALNYKATMFVITGRSLGGRNTSYRYHLTKAELQEMSKSGRWDIQAHTKNGHDLYKIDKEGTKGHFYTNRLWLDSKNRLETIDEFSLRIKNDLNESKNDIQEYLGIQSIAFAFPFGDFGQDSSNFPESNSILLSYSKEIFPMSFYQAWPGEGYIANYPNKNSFLIKRINVVPQWNVEELLEQFKQSEEKKLPFSENMQIAPGWKEVWGILSIKDDRLILQADTLTNGASMFLLGTFLWKDYSFETYLDWKKGQTVSLLARYADDYNYVACNFSEASVIISEHLKNTAINLAEKENTLKLANKDIKLSIDVDGNSVRCYVNDKLIASATGLTKELKNGGVGFNIWDPALNTSQIVIKKVKIEEIH